MVVKYRRLIKGELYKTTVDGYVKLKALYDDDTCKVVFIDTGTIVVTRKQNVRTGKLKDPYKPSVFGVGFIGVGEFKSREGKKLSKLYRLWADMLRRCYAKDDHSYLGCTVVKRWHNFQIFCEDILKMPNWNTPGFDLDKDLRVLGNKKYGPKYCSFVPKEVNSFITKAKLVVPVKNGNRYIVRFREHGKTVTVVAATSEKAYRKYIQRKSTYMAERLTHLEVHPQIVKNLSGKWW